MLVAIFLKKLYDIIIVNNRTRSVRLGYNIGPVFRYIETQSE